MDIEYFTADPDVKRAVRDAEAMRDKVVSDIVDGSNHQYVDLVMEGGGVFGIALIGYTYVLESAGIRFLGLGGTSAGAVNALLLAAVGPASKAKSVTLIEMLSKLTLADFADGDEHAQRFVHSFIKSPAWPALLRHIHRAALAYDSIEDILGLNPGQYFLDWLMEVLAQHNIRSNRDLTAHLRSAAPGLRLRGCDVPLSPNTAGARLAIVASDLTTQTKVEFPRMVGLYWNDPDDVNPANFARAAVSIPFFFQPYRVSGIPQHQQAQDAWRDVFPGDVPQEVLLVDGGILSNFPIDLFHRRGVPHAPTFGARVTRDRSKAQHIRRPFELAAALFNSARHSLDYDFIMRNEDYGKLVSLINTVGQSWLDFQLPAEAKLELFRNGARTAASFLEKFDWRQYKKIRLQRSWYEPETLLRAHLPGSPVETG